MPLSSCSGPLRRREFLRLGTLALGGLGLSDLLAAEGLRFTDFHSNGPMCSATRAALLTGRYQSRFRRAFEGALDDHRDQVPVQQDRWGNPLCFQVLGFQRPRERNGTIPSPRTPLTTPGALKPQHLHTFSFLRSADDEPLRRFLRGVLVISWKENPSPLLPDHGNASRCLKDVRRSIGLWAAVSGDVPVRSRRRHLVQEPLATCLEYKMG